ncbi:ABC transporter ATP-binding protein, partial [Micrococcus sp. SIMBA_144]
MAGALHERMMTVANPILEIEDLQIHFATQAGIVQALEGVRLAVDAGECVGLVGETGCGKSAT